MKYLNNYKIIIINSFIVLVLRYHNHDKIEIGINYGDDLWEVAAVNEQAVIKYLKNIGISEETIYKLQTKIKKQEVYFTLLAFYFL